MGGSTCLIVLNATASFHFGVCFYLIEMVADLRGRVRKIDDILTKSSILPLHTSYSTSTLISMKIIEEIRIHNECIRIAGMLQDVMSAIIFEQLVMGNTGIAFTAFKLAYQATTANFDVLVSIYELNFSLMPTYIYCHLSNEVMFSFAEIGDIFYECPWYKLHRRQKQMLLLAIQRAQQGFCFNGLGLIYCTLDGFLSVNYSICLQQKKTICFQKKTICLQKYRICLQNRKFHFFLIFL